MLRKSIAITLAAIALAACASHSPGDMRNMNRAVDLKGYLSYSWGRPGITMEEYNVVAVECTARAILDPVVPRASSLLGFGDAGDPGMSSLEYSRAAIEAQSQAREERRQRQGIMDACLTEFGFVKFGLTADQIAMLDTMPRGTPERREYLRSLAADPDILHRQGI